MPNVGPEPMNLRLRVSCSPDWPSQDITKFQQIVSFSLSSILVDQYIRLRHSEQHVMFTTGWNEDQQCKCKDLPGSSLAKETKYPFLQPEGNLTFPSCVPAQKFHKISGTACCSTEPALSFGSLGKILFFADTQNCYWFPAVETKTESGSRNCRNGFGSP